MSATPEAWIDGRRGAQLSVFDRGLHYGDGLFETIACLNGRPRLLERHLGRLAAGCARLALPAPPRALIEAEIATALKDTPRAVLKLIVTRGAAAVRGYAAAPEAGSTRILLRYPWAAEDAGEAEAGVRVRVAALRLGENPHLAGLKHLNRLEQVLARREWSDPAIAEALLYSASGALISGTMSNLFLVHGGVLATARLERCGVAGIMRGVVGGLACECGIDFQERRLTAEDLQHAEEIFLTNALTGIRAVREVPGRTLGIGPVTHRLQQALAPLLRGERGAPG
ncbi:MAG TPA: aminodeoxychorismate lyase [Steroidobacteraceae bacterium]|nr:aminodeoxychorismate lyase [Steroidobacteraceae bacterium]